MHCFVFWKTKRTPDICLSEEFLHRSIETLFSCGWKYFETYQRVSSLFLFSPTTFAFVIVKSENNYIVILSKIQ